MDPLFCLLVVGISRLTSTYVTHIAVNRYHRTIARHFRLPELSRRIALEEYDDDRCQVQKHLHGSRCQPNAVGRIRIIEVRHNDQNLPLRRIESIAYSASTCEYRLV